MIQKKVILKNETYIIQQSEKTQRMRLYMKIHEKWKSCVLDCVKSSIKDTENECKTLCEPIFNEYVKKMSIEYENKPEKLLEEVSGEKLFKRKTYRKNLWERIVG